MGLLIRFATAQDAEVIVSFVRGLAQYEREPEAVEVTPEVLRGQMDSDDPPFECLIAEEDGAPVGFALFFRNYSTWRGRPGLFLEDLFVPDAPSPQRYRQRSAQAPRRHRGGTRLRTDGMVGAQLEHARARLLPFTGRSPDGRMDYLAGFRRRAGPHHTELTQPPSEK